MEAIIQAIEVFALVTGVIYVVLEIFQKNLMWFFGIAMGLACAFSFAVQQVWAQMGLNIYYVAMSVWGIIQWRRDAKRLDADRSAGRTGTAIHLRRLDRRTVLWSLAVFVSASALLIVALRLLGGSESDLDAVVTVMSAIAMFWLARTYPEEWLLWILADSLLTVLCLRTRLYWMAVLYAVYVVAAVYGWYHWKKHGVYVADTQETEKS